MGNALSQNQRVIQYLEQNGSITALDALNELGIMRLASRIADIRKLGYKITSGRAYVANRYGNRCYVSRYTLHKEVDTK